MAAPAPLAAPPPLRTHKRARVGGVHGRSTDLNLVDGLLVLLLAGLEQTLSVVDYLLQALLLLLEVGGRETGRVKHGTGFMG